MKHPTRRLAAATVLCAGLFAGAVQLAPAAPTTPVIVHRAQAADAALKPVVASFAHTERSLRSTHRVEAADRTRTARLNADMQRIEKLMQTLAPAASGLSSTAPAAPSTGPSVGELAVQLQIDQERLAAQRLALQRIERRSRRLAVSAGHHRRHIARAIGRQRVRVRHLAHARAAQRLAAGLVRHERAAFARAAHGQAPGSGWQVQTPGTVAVAAALTRLGMPYAYGSAGPTSFDCSGLTRWAYAHAGITLDHYSGAQWTAGPHVRRADLLPGDLVFFDGLGHVGMYVGDGRFIHAPHSGDVVRIEALASRGDYLGAVRPW